MQKEDITTLTKDEIIALTDFVMKRLERLDPKPKIFGKKAWRKRFVQFHNTFIRILEQGNHSFYSAIWQFFELNDKLFLGENGMRELAQFTHRENGQWYYHNPYNQDYFLIYPNGNYWS